MIPRRVFLIAYACSGLAGLIYQVNWTRLLTLFMGHSAAAASTVVAAFMGGLGGGALLGARFIPRLTPHQALYVYVGLESLVLVAALLLPVELASLTPLLSWSYGDGAAGPLFPMVRLLVCLTLVLIPALALGATFPAAVRWFANNPEHPGRPAGELYAANTIGAATGAVAAGFVLIPALGISGTTLVGVAGSSVAIILGLVVASRFAGPMPAAGPSRSRARRPRVQESQRPQRRWLAVTVLALTGFATLTGEIAWTRTLSMIIGPTTYAFAATVTAMIAGIALGSVCGAWLAGRVRQPAVWLAAVLAGSAIANTWASSLAGSYVPRLVAEQFVRAPLPLNQLVMAHASLIAMLILPAAIGLGIAFPLALEIAGHADPSGGAGKEDSTTGRLGIVYGVNTLAGVIGSLTAGFVLIPLFGLQNTLRSVSGVLAVGGLVAAVWGTQARQRLIAASVPAASVFVALMWSPGWDRELLASGVYKYSPHVQESANLEPADLFKAGTLLYYREGAASTVSVKRLAGTVSLSIDGKVDASSSGDMLTQKLLAHMPLLLHSDPRDVLIIGLGSGVTLASALVHPVIRTDVVEISPQIVEASRYFADETGAPLGDPRTRLIIGDGRTHLQLSARTYDVIISEPSNPWMAGVAALFTREFFSAARDRLAPGGVICQWAHTYDISDSDLRSIVGTFLSVFPDGTAWLVGGADVLLIASQRPLDMQMQNLERGWHRPGVAADLRDRDVLEPFALMSLFVGGPEELRRYAEGASLQTDDRMGLEFSGPRAVYGGGSPVNALTLRRLLDVRAAPETIRQARAMAGPAQWRNRGVMMLSAEDYESAYQDFSSALAIDPEDGSALDGLVRSAVAVRRESHAAEWLKSAIAARPQSTALRVALSKLYAAGGAFDAAVDLATEAWKINPQELPALEQLASIFADLGDAGRLEQVLEVLRRTQPAAPRVLYYEASVRFLRGQLPDALPLAQRAVEHLPADAAARNLLGAIHASSGRAAEARTAFEDALRLNPLDAATYANLGVLELESGNRNAAARLFAEALSLDPQSQMALKGLGRTR